MWWILYSTAASIVAFLFIVLLLDVLELPFLVEANESGPTLTDQLIGALIFGMSGFIIGFGQWMVLRMTFLATRKWMLASAGGWLLGYATNVILRDSVSGIFDSAMVLFFPWLVIGLWAGILQWIILRRRYRDSSAWITMSALAVLIGASGWIVGSICGGSLSWAIAGALNGYTFLRLKPLTNVESTA